MCGYGDTDVGRFNFQNSENQRYDIWQNDIKQNDIGQNDIQ